MYLHTCACVFKEGWLSSSNGVYKAGVSSGVGREVSSSSCPYFWIWGATQRLSHDDKAKNFIACSIEQGLYRIMCLIIVKNGRRVGICQHVLMSKRIR